MSPLFWRHFNRVAGHPKGMETSFITLNLELTHRPLVSIAQLQHCV